MPDPTVPRMVVYRSRLGYDLAAVIVATEATLDPKGVQLYRETRDPTVKGVDLNAHGVPPLSSPDHVHLVVLSPGLPGNPEPPSDLDASRGGTYREWNVPLFEPSLIPDPRPGAVPQAAPVEPGSWRWPERT